MVDVGVAGTVGHSALLLLVPDLLFKVFPDTMTLLQGVNASFWQIYILPILA